MTKIIYILLDKMKKFPESNFTLNGFNLGFEKNNNDYTFDLSQCEIKEFSKEDKENFYDNLKS